MHYLGNLLVFKANRIQGNKTVLLTVELKIQRTTKLSFKSRTTLLHISLNPVEEVSDFSEDSWLILASSGSPRHDSDDIVLSGSGLGRADQGSTRVTHAGGLTVGSEANHAWPDHVGPTGLQVGILPDAAGELLELIGSAARRFDESPAWEGETRDVRFLSSK